MCTCEIVLRKERCVFGVKKCTRSSSIQINLKLATDTADSCAFHCLVRQAFLTIKFMLTKINATLIYFIPHNIRERNLNSLSSYSCKKANG